jgi:hypothetical protein
MPVPRKTLARRSAAMLVAAGVAVLASAGSAFGLGPPPNLRSTPGSPSNSPDWIFTWGAPAPDPGYQVSSYQWRIDAGPWRDTTVTFATTRLNDGTHTIRVRAIETAVPQDPPPDPPPAPTVEGAEASLSVRVDRTRPEIRASLSPSRPNGGGGWYRSLRVLFTCDDDSGSVTCPPAVTLGDRGAADQGRNQVRSGTARDAAGNERSDSSPRFDFDGIGPRTGEPQTPSANARVGAQPTFRWSSGGDATSGVQRYDVLAGWPGRGEHVVASVPHQPGRSSFSSPASGAFPERTPITWRVRTYDIAGNSTTSFSRNFTVDSTVPPAPAITAGPASFTNQNAPTFAWAGTLGTYQWSVSQAGATEPVQQGQGAATSVTLAPLPDGDYTFQVTQSTASSVPSDEATRTFHVDTVAPPPPAITARPPFPTVVTQPSFTWTSAEEAPFFRWQVVSATGAGLQGPNDTPLTSATIGVVPAGAYTFRLWQIDPAGNVSAPANDPFSVLGTTATAQQPGTRATLPRVNANRLKPRAGTVVKTRTPTLSWTSASKGTTLYNLQLFRVVRRPPGRPSVVKKVFTAFPRRTSITLPRSKVKPSTCYVWRIWPYRGSKFTPKPLGISNFCVAKASVIRKQAKAKARTKARARAAAATRRAADR